MARRNDHSREELINMTLNHVEQFLVENSYHALSLRKVAGMIGYVPSTLVNVFGNYNLLLLNVVARALDELSDKASHAMENASGSKEALYQLAYCYLDFAAQHPNRWQLVFEHNMQGDTLPQWQSDRIQGMTKMLETLLQSLAPHRPEREVVEASRVLWAGVHGITLLSVDDKLFTSEPVAGKVLIDNLINSYLSTWCAE